MRTRLSTEQRRSQLLTIGTKLFAERSYEQVSIEEVATIARISSGLLYHYFPSKQAFFTAIVDAEGAKLLRASNPDITLEPFDQIKASVAVYIDYAARFPDGFRVAHAGASNNDDLRQLHEDRTRAQRDRILASLTTIRPIAAQDFIAVTAWLAFVRFAILGWLDEASTTSAEVLHDLCARTLWAALALPDVDAPIPPTTNWGH